MNSNKIIKIINKSNQNFQAFAFFEKILNVYHVNKWRFNWSKDSY